MNAQQLKNSILQEAIEGRLVPQDPNDEPASVLLDKIRAEKKRLVKEGKLKKKDLEETPISEDEKPFEIPDSWEWVRYSEIFNVRSAKRIHQSDWKTEGVPFFRGRELVQLIRTGSVNSDVFISNELYKSLEEYGIPAKDDILISAVGTIGRVYVVKGTKPFYYKDAYILCCENIAKIDPSYIAIALKSPYLQKQIHKDSMATTVAQLTIERAKNLVLPLPPLAEQKRIVAKIEELLPMVEEYGKAQDALDKLNKELPERLKKSVLQEAISGKLVSQDPNDEPASALLNRIREEKKRLVKEGKLKKKDLEETPISEDEKPFEIPESWEWVRLNTLFSIFTGKKDANFGDSNGTYDFFTCSNTPIKSLTYSYDGEYLIMPGNGANIGQVIHYKGKFEAYQRTYLLQPYVTISLEYLKYHLLFNWKEYNRSKLYGSAIPYIKLDNLTSYLVAIPPLAEQKRIVEKIEQLFHEIDKLKVG